MKKNIIAMILCITGLLVLSGCNAMYGKIQYNPENIKNIQAESALPDYQFYYIGRANLPDAVIGLDSRYQFNDRLWYTIGTKKEVLDKIDRLNNSPENDGRLTGADILDDRGTKIGIWYSYYSYTIVKLSPVNILDIFNPYTPNGYDDNY